jgi:hypothetical protein
MLERQSQTKLMYNKDAIGIILKESRDKLVGKNLILLMTLEESFRNALQIRVMQKNLGVEISHG